RVVAHLRGQRPLAVRFVHLPYQRGDPLAVLVVAGDDRDLLAPVADQLLGDDPALQRVRGVYAEVVVAGRVVVQHHPGAGRGDLDDPRLLEGLDDAQAAAGRERTHHRPDPGVDQLLRAGLDDLGVLRVALVGELDGHLVAPDPAGRVDVRHRQ